MRAHQEDANGPDWPRLGRTVIAQQTRARVDLVILNMCLSACFGLRWRPFWAAAPWTCRGGLKSGARGDGYQGYFRRFDGTVLGKGVPRGVGGVVVVAGSLDVPRGTIPRRPCFHQRNRRLRANRSRPLPRQREGKCVVWPVSIHARKGRTRISDLGSRISGAERDFGVLQIG